MPNEYEELNYDNPEVDLYNGMPPGFDDQRNKIKTILNTPNELNNRYFGFFVEKAFPEVDRDNVDDMNSLREQLKDIYESKSDDDIPSAIDLLKILIGISDKPTQEKLNRIREQGAIVNPTYTGLNPEPESGSRVYEDVAPRGPAIQNATYKGLSPGRSRQGAMENTTYEHIEQDYLDIATDNCESVDEDKFNEYKNFVSSIKPEAGSFDFNSAEEIQNQINQASSDFCDTNKFLEELWCSYKKKHVELMSVLSLIDDVQPIIYQMMTQIPPEAEKIYIPIMGEDGKPGKDAQPIPIPMGPGQGPGPGPGPRGPLGPTGAERPEEDNEYLDTQPEPGDNTYVHVKDTYKPIVEYLIKLITKQKERNDPRKNIMKELNDAQSNVLATLQKDPEFKELLKHTSDENYRKTIGGKWEKIFTPVKKDAINAFLRFKDAGRYKLVEKSLNDKLGRENSFQKGDKVKFTETGVDDSNNSSLNKVAEKLKTLKTSSTNDGATLAPAQGASSLVGGERFVSEEDRETINGFNTLNQNRIIYDFDGNKERINGKDGNPGQQIQSTNPFQQFMNGGGASIKSKKNQKGSGKYKSRINRFRSVLKKKKLNTNHSHRLNRFFK